VKLRSTRLAAAARRGLTLVELVLAAGLLAILLAAVFKLLDQFMGVWEKSEVRRMEVEQASGLSELLAADLDGLEPGPRGDLLAEWLLHDTDGNGVGDTLGARVRLVRHATPAELARLQAGSETKLPGEGLLEVLWAVTPASPGTRNLDERAQSLLWRGERVWGPARGADVSFFAEGAFAASGRPRPGSAHVLTGDVLWFSMSFATALSDLRGEWRIGSSPEDCAASWDAWSRGRPDRDRHPWNETSPFVPAAASTPALPRRVRLEFELESPSDFTRRTRVLRSFGPQDSSFEVDNTEKLPEEGAYVRVDAEWLQILGVTGATVGVRRAQRGSKALGHESGALVHWGRRFVREAPIAQHRGEWRR
jgi:hypothetical protein